MLARLFARQLADPHGLLGRAVARLMNRSNWRMNRRAIELLAVAPEDRVLETGFGGGAALAALLQAVHNGHVAGLDPSGSMVSRASAIHRDALAQGRLTLAQGSAEALPWPAGSFSRVLSVNTLYFWRDRGKVLSEVRRVLVPGGRVVLGYRPPDVMRRLPISRYGFEMVEEAELRRQMGAAGFEVKSVEASSDDGLGYACVVGIVPAHGS